MRYSYDVALKAEYDVIIIGAGIAGLVCGCYLAKAGKKVLLVDQHDSPGGCCTSFKRNGFVFDSGIHSLGSCREGGPQNLIYKELGLLNKIKLLRSNPIDIIFYQDYRIHFYQELEDTIKELSDYFPDESFNLRKFFNLLRELTSLQLYSKLKGLTFRELLNQFFLNDDLKNILGSFSMNLCLPDNEVAAIVMAIMYRETILDGGYYPEGGMQCLSDAYAQRFLELSGTLLLSRKVVKIHLKSFNEVSGIRIDKTDEDIKARCIVTACDIRQTIFNLLSPDFFNPKIVNHFNEMKESASGFMVYLGLNKKVSHLFSSCASAWFLPSKNYQKIMQYPSRGILDLNDSAFILISPSFRDQSLAPEKSESIYLLTMVPYESKEFWDKTRVTLESRLIKRLTKFIPDLEKMIIVRENATPFTLHRYTLNNHGAMVGWSSTPNQVENLRIPHKFQFINLYFCGHWTSSLAGYGGVTHVSSSGCLVANQILREGY
jgi:phytoene dehydrogenase-like protein